MNNIISLSNFIGQKRTIECLKIGIKATIKSQETMDHILFYGPAGVGKTTLAQSIAYELNTNIKIIQGINISKINDLIGVISTIKQGEILFIDEIHTIRKELAEILYPALENKAIDLIIGKGINKKNIRISIPDFTLIAATTNLGDITKSLEERFGYIFYLEEYTPEEMKEIINQKNKQMGLNLNSKEISEIIGASKGIPRNAARILKRIKDYRTADEKTSVQNIIKACGFVHKGLSDMDIKYLMAIKDHYESLISISCKINLDKKTILNKIEPYMYSSGLIIKNSKGRSLSEKGKRIIREYAKENKNLQI